MTAQNQDFSVYSGDGAEPTFTVYHADGVTPVDIALCSEIVWEAARDAASTPVISKKLSTGGITKVAIGSNSPGQDGVFRVILKNADTASLTGTYLHRAVVTDVDADATKSTVALGRIVANPNRSPVWSYDPTRLATSDLMRVRRLIGDVLVNDKQIFDEEISFTLSVRPNIYGAGADCCRYIAAQYARKVDIVQPEARMAYSAQARNYEMRAVALDRMAALRGSGLPYAGGISQMDKLNRELDSDRVPPQFNLGMQDNALPVSAAGNEIPGSPGTNVPWP